MIQNAKIAMRKEAAQSRFYRVWGSQRCCWCVSVRLAVCPGKGGKPSVLITKTFEIYLGNPTDDVRCLFKAATLSGSTLGRLRSKSSRVPWKRREMKCLLEVSRICTYFLKSVSFFKRLLSKIEPISLIIPRGDLTSVRMSP